MVSNTIKIIFVRRDLGSGIVGPRRRQLCFVSSGRKRRGHVIREIEAFYGEVNKCLELVGKRPFEGESLKVNKENRWQTGEGEGFGRLPECFTAGTVPHLGLFKDLGLDKRVQALI